MQTFDPFNGQMDAMDVLSVISLWIGIKNYEENLSQSDKDDLMHKLDEQTNSILERLIAEMNRQNSMLEHIVELLEERK